MLVSPLHTSKICFEFRDSLIDEQANIGASEIAPCEDTVPRRDFFDGTPLKPEIRVDHSVGTLVFFQEPCNDIGGHDAWEVIASAVCKPAIRTERAVEWAEFAIIAEDVLDQVLQVLERNDAHWHGQRAPTNKFSASKVVSVVLVL